MTYIPSAMSGPNFRLHYHDWAENHGFMNLYKKEHIDAFKILSLLHKKFFLTIPRNSFVNREICSSHRRQISEYELRLQGCQSLSSDLGAVVQAVHLKWEFSDHRTEQYWGSCGLQEGNEIGLGLLGWDLGWEFVLNYMTVAIFSS